MTRSQHASTSTAAFNPLTHGLAPFSAPPIWLCQAGADDGVSLCGLLRHGCLFGVTFVAFADVKDFIDASCAGVRLRHASLPSSSTPTGVFSVGKQIRAKRPLQGEII